MQTAAARSVEPHSYHISILLSKYCREINDRAFPWILPEDKSLSFRLTVNLTGCLKGQSSFFHAVCKGKMTKQVANVGTGEGELGRLHEIVLAFHTKFVKKKE